MGDAQALVRLARLQSEVAIDVGALQGRAEEIGSLLVAWNQRGSLGRADLMLVAMNLHGYYTALETLLERIARLLDENVPAGPTWHIDLLGQMQVEIPGLRPRVIEPELAFDLQELRKFRHFFRNAYVLEFDPEHVGRHAERLQRIHPSVARAIGTFQLHLDHVVEALARSARS